MDLTALFNQYHDYVELALAVLGVASIVARLTPTQTDNKILDKVYTAIHFLGFTKPQ